MTYSSNILVSSIVNSLGRLLSQGRSSLFLWQILNMLHFHCVKIWDLLFDVAGFISNIVNAFGSIFLTFDCIFWCFYFCIFFVFHFHFKFHFLWGRWQICVSISFTSCRAFFLPWFFKFTFNSWLVTFFIVAFVRRLFFIKP